MKQQLAAPVEALMQQQRNNAAAVAQPQADYQRQLQVQLQKQQAVFDKHLQQVLAGWEQQ